MIVITCIRAVVKMCSVQLWLKVFTCISTAMVPLYCFITVLSIFLCFYDDIIDGVRGPFYRPNIVFYCTRNYNYPGLTFALSGE